MRVGLVVMKHHHVLVIRQLAMRELARCPPHEQRVGPAWHRQHDVEGLTPVADVFAQRIAKMPFVNQFAQDILALPRLTPLVPDLEPAVLADVAQERRNGRHTAPSPRDLDHDLWGVADHAGVLPDGWGPPA